MCDDNNVKRLLRAARESQAQPAEPSSAVADRVKTALFNFFQPVYDILTQLREQDVRFRCATGRWVRVPDGQILRVAAWQADTIPQVVISLDARTQLIIGIATRKGAIFPGIIQTAQWRCRLQTAITREELATTLIDNVPALTVYITTLAAQYEKQRPHSAAIPPIAIPPIAVPPDPAAREHRVIMLDGIPNDLNEETPEC